VHDDRNITEARIDRVFNQRIRPAVFTDSLTFDVEAWEVPGEPVPVTEAVSAHYAPFSVGSGFSRPWGTTWFKMSATVPEHWAGEHVQAEIHLAYSDMPGFTSEALIWTQTPTGEWTPWRGIHPAAHHVTLARPATGGERIELLVEAASNPSIIEGFPDANSDLDTAGTTPIHTLASARLVVRHDDVHGLIHDVSVLRSIMRQLPLDQPPRWEILGALEAAISAIDLEDVPGSAGAARDALSGILARPAPQSAHRVSAIGHAHMDTAWLWPLRETQRKCSRTFANVLRLMEDHPEFRFCCSQAAQYEWMLDGYPHLFAEISARVAEGRWVPVGGMWVEADTNLAGGEALLRQFTHGQRFFAEHFGLRCTETWIPDVFGYPASLPGIMEHAGIERFLTQKLSWNQTNRFPHQSFWWEGIDGSTVFTHFPPVETYNATFEPHELFFSVRNFAERGRATRSLMPFGWGDGGGGPSPDMMETFQRTRNLEWTPLLEIESPEAFFDAAIEEYPDAPRWIGELYLEMHRGTLTSQADTKVGNRRCELLLREAELWWTTAATLLGNPSLYPAAELDRIWKTVLLHQFHDILPGSSIGWVHREAAETYAELGARLEELIAEALTMLAPTGPAVANAAPDARTEVAVLDADDPATSAVAGSSSTQALSDGSTAVVVSVPALGVAPLGDHRLDGAVSAETTAGSTVLRNEFVEARIDADGTIGSLVNRRSGRELIVPGERANELQIHPDLPNAFDAWDIEHFNRRQVAPIDGPVSIEVTDTGPLVARVVVERTFRSSTVRQTFELRAGSPRLDVHAEFDWHEQEQLLQVAFPLDLHTTDLTREIQFGRTTTAIHTNTSWDAARFEVCAHRWVSLGERGAGLALLNNGRYGHHAERGRSESGESTTTLFLTLLRGARYPDPRQDQGPHRCTWSLMPHDGDLDAAGVVAEGYRLNLPVRFTADGTRNDPAPPIIAVDGAGIVEAVKLADDGSGDVIVRLYESAGGQAPCTLRAGFPVDGISATDAHESAETSVRLPQLVTGGDDAGGDDTGDDTARVRLRPFQIATLRLSPR
jgi:alpha-mannosidase